MTYPIILAHGVCPFDFLWNKALSLDNTGSPTWDTLHYFKGIRAMLLAKGFDAYHSRTAWAANVQRRARGLKQNIIRVLNKTGAAKVHILAHSMGGLDCRHMLFDDRSVGKIHERIASLTTISTPHLGSPFADWGIGHFPFVIPTARKLGLDIAGLEDLRTVTCKEYNTHPDVIAFEKRCEETILFQTYAGKQIYDGVLFLFKTSFRIIEQIEGENDGLVSVESAKWREKYFKGTIDACDHFNEIGWWSPEKILDGEGPGKLLRRIHRFYADLAQGLP